MVSSFSTYRHESVCNPVLVALPGEMGQGGSSLGWDLPVPLQEVRGSGRKAQGGPWACQAQGKEPVSLEGENRPMGSQALNPPEQSTKPDQHIETKSLKRRGGETSNQTQLLPSVRFVPAHWALPSCAAPSQGAGRG